VGREMLERIKYIRYGD